MSTNKMIGDMSAWAGLLKDLFRQFEDGSITLAMLIDIVQHRNPFTVKNKSIKEWQEFYWKHLRLLVDLSKVDVPKDMDDFGRVIFVFEELTIKHVIRAMKEHFRVSSYTHPDNLDELIINHVRGADKRYAILVRDQVEADKEFNNIAAVDLNDVNAITLLERLVLELKYYLETGNHLDIERRTLCAGSRYSGSGDVPTVCWDSDSEQLYINYDGDSYSYDGHCVRQVVS